MDHSHTQLIHLAFCATLRLLGETGGVLNQASDSYRGRAGAMARTFEKRLQGFRSMEAVDARDTPRAHAGRCAPGTDACVRRCARVQPRLCSKIMGSLPRRLYYRFDYQEYTSTGVFVRCCARVHPRLCSNIMGSLPKVMSTKTLLQILLPEIHKHACLCTPLCSGATPTV